MESTPVYFVYEKLKREPAASFSESEFACKVKWNNPKHAKDLNVDDYKWRENGSRKSVNYKKERLFETYFKLPIRRGVDASAFTIDFNKRG